VPNSRRVPRLPAGVRLYKLDEHQSYIIALLFASQVLGPLAEGDERSTLVGMSLDGTTARATIWRTRSRFYVKVGAPNDINPYVSRGAYSIAGALDDAYRELRWRVSRADIVARDLSRWQIVDPTEGVDLDDDINLFEHIGDLRLVPINLRRAADHLENNDAKIFVKAVGTRPGCVIQIKRTGKMSPRYNVHAPWTGRNDRNIKIARFETLKSAIAEASARAKAMPSPKKSG